MVYFLNILSSTSPSDLGGETGRDVRELGPRFVHVFRETDAGPEVSEEGKLTDHIIMSVLDLNVPKAFEGRRVSDGEYRGGRRSRESSKTMLVATEVRAESWAGAKAMLDEGGDGGGEDGGPHGGFFTY
jgi:hypothetical protein